MEKEQRSRIARSFARPDVVAEIGRLRNYLVGQYGQLVVDSMVDRKPVQLFQ